MEQSTWEPEPVEKLVRQAQANLAVLSGNDTLRALRSGSPQMYGGRHRHGNLTRDFDCKAGLESLRGEVDVHLYKFGTIATEVTRGLADIRKEFAALKGDVVRLEDYVVHESHQHAEAFQSLSERHAESFQSLSERVDAHEADSRCNGEFSLQTVAVARAHGPLRDSSDILRRSQEEASMVEDKVLRRVAMVQEKVESQLAALEALPERWLAEHEDQLARRMQRAVPSEAMIQEVVMQMHEEMGARMQEAEQRLTTAMSWAEEFAGSLKDICESSRNEAEGVAFDAATRQLEGFKGDLLENVKVLCESSVQMSMKSLPSVSQEDASASKKEIVKAVDQRQEILETKLRADLQVLQRLMVEQIKEVDTKLRSFEQQLTHRVDELVTFCCAVKERLEGESQSKDMDKDASGAEDRHPREARQVREKSMQK